MAEVQTNPRGIPKAPFVDNVTDFVKSSDQVESVLKSFQEMLQKYKYMELNTSQRIQGLKDKIPDIKKTLDMVQFLKDGDRDEPVTANYELNDTLYAKAVLTPGETVYIWLGANVMLEYTIPEAIDLLQAKLKLAKESLGACEEDLEFLRENITIVEVNTTRVYNWDVQERKRERESK
jgi:prefoldin subunit 5